MKPLTRTEAILEASWLMIDHGLSCGELIAQRNLMFKVGIDKYKRSTKDATIERLKAEVARLVADGLEALSEDDMRRMFGDERVDADAEIGAFVARHAAAKAKDKATIEMLKGLLREVGDPDGGSIDEFWLATHDGFDWMERLAAALEEEENNG